MSLKEYEERALQAESLIKLLNTRFENLEKNNSIDNRSSSSDNYFKGKTSQTILLLLNFKYF